MAAEAGSSSAGELSSPPKSPSSLEDSITVNTTPAGGHVNYPNLLGAAAPAVSQTPANGAISQLTKAKDEGAEKAPRKRRARTVNADGKEDDSGKPAKAPRKARAPRKTKAEQDIPNPKTMTVTPTVPAITAPTAGTTVAPSLASPVTVQMSRSSSKQQKITDLVNPDPPRYQSSYANPSSTTVTYQNGGDGDAQPPQTFKTEPTTTSSMFTNPTYSPNTGQRYDPIRSSTMDNSRPYPGTSTPLQTSPTKLQYRASASPSISSLIDPPTVASNPSFSYTPPAKPSPIASHAATGTASSNSPNLLSAKPALIQASPNTLNSFNEAAQTKPVDASDAMEIDSEKPGSGTEVKNTARKGSISNTNPPSKAASPKPAKKDKDKVGTTPPLPPLPGSSAIASTLFGPGQQTETVLGPTIILHVPLNGETNKYINFARLAEEKYSFSALHPRLAAQRNRLARVAAAGAAIENAQKGSGDEMSLELMSDNEQDLSNTEMNDAGADSTKDGGKPGETDTGKKPRRKRRMKEDMYDKEDPFVDDTELAWEEQAAASKDGFFVYSGPLIPEGETARVERADGTIIKQPSSRGRGRGRGGGPGSRGGMKGRVGAAAAAAAASGSGEGGGSGGAARGGRGSGKTRAKRGERKAEREAAAAAAAATAAAASSSASAEPAGNAATSTTPVGKLVSKTEPLHASPLGQNVQVQVPSAPIVDPAAAATHDTTEAPAITA